MNKFLFLFGSGISNPAGIPKMDEITTDVLSKAGLQKGANGILRICSNQKAELHAHDNICMPCVIGGLKLIYSLAYDFHNDDYRKKEINYEDMYYVSNELYNAVVHDYPNPAVAPAIFHAEKKLGELLENHLNETGNVWGLEEVFYGTSKHIADVVRSLLWRPKKTIDYLTVLQAACNDKECRRMDVFTLNHDLLLESFFKFRGLGFDDGFVKDRGAFVWDSNCLFNSEHRIRLFKLHGSIDWYQFLKSANGYKDTLYAKHDPDNLVLKSDIPDLDPSPFPNHPQILVGTYNKVFEYQKNVFFDLQTHFFLSLRDSNSLFISGYSFNDHFINSRIINWMKSHGNRKIVIAHKNFSSLGMEASPAVKQAFSIWKEKNLLEVIPKFIEAVSWSEVKTALE